MPKVNRGGKGHPPSTRKKLADALARKIDDREAFYMRMDAIHECRTPWAWTRCRGLASSTFERATFYDGERAWLRTSRIPGHVPRRHHHLVMLLGNAYTSWWRECPGYGLTLPRRCETCGTPFWSKRRALMHRCAPAPSGQKRDSGNRRGHR